LKIKFKISKFIFFKSDCLVRSLQFEMKAQATDKLKSPEVLEHERQVTLKKVPTSDLKHKIIYIVFIFIIWYSDIVNKTIFII
jgi:hypothetical protein